jgi:predicted unusual protein kinase regulating ubiquinone biosynthesis (AarF/ABC1/UbiB family)
MEYIDGVKVNDVERLREIGVDPKWVGRVLQDVFAEMYVCHCCWIMRRLHILIFEPLS